MLPFLDLIVRRDRPSCLNTTLIVSRYGFISEIIVSLAIPIGNGILSHLGRYSLLFILAIGLNNRPIIGFSGSLLLNLLLLTISSLLERRLRRLARATMHVLLLTEEEVILISDL